jgi:hypothetical protein
MTRATTAPTGAAVPALVPWLRTVAGGVAVVEVGGGVVVVELVELVGSDVLAGTGLVVVVFGGCVVEVVGFVPTE